MQYARSMLVSGSSDFGSQHLPTQHRGVIDKRGVQSTRARKRLSTLTTVDTTLATVHCDTLLHQADGAHELSGGVVGTLNRLEAVGRVGHELLKRGPHLRRDVVALQVAEA